MPEAAASSAPPDPQLIDRDGDARLYPMTQPEDRWSEADSRTFIDIANVAVPGRAEQFEMLLSLVPATPGEAFQAVELCCGEGIFAESLLERFPEARLIALDGSATMLDRARERLNRFGDRVQVAQFDLDSPGWLAALPGGLRYLSSSLAFHHLSGEDKRRVFGELAGKLGRGGALMIADITEPLSDVVRIAFRDLMDSIAREQSLALTGDLEAFRTFEEEEWNGFARERQPPGEMPSRLFDQLKWLEEAGLNADCFWMRAGVAIYGGYR
jgi:ubiquinone/menaquinone biosynthesis C-methylase UbiE